jgi:NAD(P)-dependent dehydrogenase (short-subunit alcohol dehydrogenase family)
MLNSNMLSGKVIVVTGAAGEIGAATAGLMMARGATVVAVDRKGANFDALQADVADGDRLAVLEADVTDEAAVAAYARAAKEKFGHLDAFINNAGIEGVVKPIPDYPLDVFQKVIAVNVVGVFLGLKHVIPIMAERGRGSIVNMSSVAGLIGSPGMAGYVASKHAVIGLTRTAALEWAPKGLRVNCVNPGPIESRMMSSLEEGAMPGQAAKAHEAFAHGVAAGRYGRAEEVATLVAFLCSDDSAYINGAIHAVDGGMTAA